MAIKISKLTKTEFFDVYGISLILAKRPDQPTLHFLADILKPIALRYHEITHYATTAELRYFLSGRCKAGVTIDDYEYEEMSESRKINKKLLKKLGITNWRVERKTLRFDNIYTLFVEGSWADGVYGGEAWGEIALAGEKLDSVLPVTSGNITAVVSAIDRLNDLEHNNCLYLAQYATFNLSNALDAKAEDLPEDVIRQCSKEIRDIYKELA